MIEKKLTYFSWKFKVLFAHFMTVPCDFPWSHRQLRFMPNIAKYVCCHSCLVPQMDNVYVTSRSNSTQGKKYFSTWCRQKIKISRITSNSNVLFPTHNGMYNKYEKNTSNLTNTRRNLAWSFDYEEALSRQALLTNMYIIY